MLHLTPNAIARVQTLRTREKNPDLKLRVYIQGGGCSGFQYGFSFEGAVSEDDQVIETEGGEAVVVDPMSLTYLEGSVIDYISGLKGAYFQVKNPHAKTTCSCGSSFSLGDLPSEPVKEKE